MFSLPPLSRHYQHDLINPDVLIWREKYIRSPHRRTNYPPECDCTSLPIQIICNRVRGGGGEGQGEFKFQAFGNPPSGLKRKLNLKKAAAGFWKSCGHCQPDSMTTKLNVIFATKTMEHIAHQHLYAHFRSCHLRQALPPPSIHHTLTPHSNHLLLVYKVIEIADVADYINNLLSRLTFSQNRPQRQVNGCGYLLPLFLFLECQPNSKGTITVKPVWCCALPKTPCFAVRLWTVRPWRVRLAAGQWSPRFAGHYFVSWPGLVCVIIIIINSPSSSTTTSSLQPSSSTHMHIDVLLCICFSANLVQLKRLVLAYFYTALSAQHTSIFCSGSQTYFA